MGSAQLLESLVRRIFYRFWKTFVQSGCIFAGNFIFAVYNVPTSPCMPASYFWIPTGPIRLRKSIRGCAVLTAQNYSANYLSNFQNLCTMIYRVSCTCSCTGWTCTRTCTQTCTRTCTTGLNMYTNMYTVLYRFERVHEHVHLAACTCLNVYKFCTGSCTCSNMYTNMYINMYKHF